MKVQFKISKTLTSFEEEEMNEFVSSLERKYSVAIARTDHNFYTVFEFEIDWKNYQEILELIKNASISRPYLILLQ